MSPEISVVDYYRGVLTPNVGERVIEDGYPAVSSCKFDFTAKSVFISTWTEGKPPRQPGTYKLSDRDLEKLKSFLNRSRGIENPYQKEMDSGLLFEAETLSIFYKDVDLVPTYNSKHQYLAIQRAGRLESKSAYKSKLTPTDTTVFMNELISHLEKSTAP